MSQRVTFTRTQTVTIDFADSDRGSAQPSSRGYWSQWANHMFSGHSAIDMMLTRQAPADNIVDKDLGRWEAITAVPPFAKDPR